MLLHLDLTETCVLSATGFSRVLKIFSGIHYQSSCPAGMRLTLELDFKSTLR